MNNLEFIETPQVNKTLPEFGPGDTVIVRVKIKEGDRERLQAFEGVVIGKRNRALNGRAIAVAEGLLTTGDKTARWIANDALRELRGEQVQQRLQR